MLEALAEDGSGTDDLIRYLNRSGCFPAYANTEVTYFPVGEDKFAALMEALRAARKFIFMEYFIIEEGYMWGSILEVLVQKAAEGVDVRVMYDGMCEISLLPADYCKRLREKGIKARAYAPIKPVVSSHYNYRDHRKIAVIDGEVAFNGGVNLADEYINKKRLFGHWKDNALLLRGDAVRSFTLMFLQMWNVESDGDDFSRYLSVSAPVHGAPGIVLPYGDSPLDDERTGEMVYIDILNRAQRYVHIMTPYLILDGETVTALTFAAKRGVDVCLLLPHVPDKRYAFALAKTHYAELLQAGVRILEYTPGFVHAKLFVSDDCKAVAGTVNMDYRSFYLHFECGVYLRDVPAVADIERDFQRTAAECREIRPEDLRKIPPLTRLAGWLLKVFAPVM